MLITRLASLSLPNFLTQFHAPGNFLPYFARPPTYIQYAYVTPTPKSSLIWSWANFRMQRNGNPIPERGHGAVLGCERFLAKILVYVSSLGWNWESRTFARKCNAKLRTCMHGDCQRASSLYSERCRQGLGVFITRDLKLRCRPYFCRPGRVGWNRSAFSD